MTVAQFGDPDAGDRGRTGATVASPRGPERAQPIPTNPAPNSTRMTPSTRRGPGQRRAPTGTDGDRRSGSGGHAAYNSRASRAASDGPSADASARSMTANNATGASGPTARRSTAASSRTS